MPKSCWTWRTKSSTRLCQQSIWRRTGLGSRSPSLSVPLPRARARPSSYSARLSRKCAKKRRGVVSSVGNSVSRRTARPPSSRLALRHPQLQVHRRPTHFTRPHPARRTPIPRPPKSAKHRSLRLHTSRFPARGARLTASIDSLRSAHRHSPSFLCALPHSHTLFSALRPLLLTQMTTNRASQDPATQHPTRMAQPVNIQHVVRVACRTPVTRAMGGCRCVIVAERDPRFIGSSACVLMARDGACVRACV
mmetsp:Transcript_15603/g.42022  ORF Transcript_15603/g.42022 Transcript_15603/m.42022 type:complete len:250 (+) Transcript_15603:1553-2302(+)